MVVLRSYNFWKDEIPHDYLDDLESFLYVVVFLLLTYMPDGSFVSTEDEVPPIIRSWAIEPPNEAAVNKKEFIREFCFSRSSYIVDKNWGPIYTNVFEKFRRFAARIISHKEDILRRPRHQAGSNPLAKLHKGREKHYEEVLAMFDNAIKAVHADAAAVSQPAPVVVTCPPPTVLPEPRRSTRPDTLHGTKQDHSSAVPDALQSTEPKATATSSPVAETPNGQSARLLKRRVEDAEQHPDVPQPKARRLVKRLPGKSCPQ